IVASVPSSPRFAALDYRFKATVVWAIVVARCIAVRRIAEPLVISRDALMLVNSRHTGICVPLARYEISHCNSFISHLRRPPRPHTHNSQHRDRTQDTKTLGPTRTRDTR